MGKLSKFARVARIVAYVMSLTLVDLGRLEAFLNDKENSLKAETLNNLS